jgi:hypothetical protein
MSHKPIAIPVEPGLVERTLRRFGYVKFRPASVIHKVETPVGVPGLDDIVPPPLAAGPGSRYAGVYMASPWVYVAVNRIAKRRHWYRSASTSAACTSARPRPALTGRPRPRTASRSAIRTLSPGCWIAPTVPQPLRMLEQTVGCLEIFGNPTVSRRAAGRPAPGTLAAAPGSRRHRADSRRGVGGYIYEIDGHASARTGEVVHFRRWHRPMTTTPQRARSRAAGRRIRPQHERLEPPRLCEGLAVPAGIVAIPSASAMRF